MALAIQTLLANIGYGDVDIQKKFGTFVLSRSNNEETIVQSIEECNFKTDVVYDLTVQWSEGELQVFNTGAFVVHNTDSVMVRFFDIPKTLDGLPIAFKLGEEAAAWPPMLFLGSTKEIELEMEKACNPYFLFEEKKKYLSRSNGKTPQSRQT